MANNITIAELLGGNFKDVDYAVTSNWRIDFSACEELKALMEDAGEVSLQMSYACHSDFQFTANIEYAEATLKGMHISQAAWQDRFIDSLTLDVYESMDHRVFKALLKAANNTAGYYKHRNINAKNQYTFTNVTLTALGNSIGSGSAETQLVYNLQGMQINSVQSPNYTSDSAEIASVQLDLRVHGWTVVDIDA